MRSILLLLLGAMIGIILAATGLLDNQSELLQNSNTTSIAEVNDISIPENQFISIVKGIAENKKSSLQDAEYEFILQKIIDEELLVQRGQELGLLQLNSVLRSNMSQAVTTSIISENASIEPSESELKTFYQTNQNYFQPATKISFSHMKFSKKLQGEIAQQLLFEGNNFNEVKEKHSDKEIVSIPKGLLSINSIRQYFGPSLTETIASLPTEQTSTLIEQNQAWYIFYIHEQELGQAPAFENVQEIVRNEYKRQLNEKSIHEYLLWLRKRASIEKMDVSELRKIIDTTE